MELQALRPIRKDLVYDLVEEAGFDTADWIASSSRPNAYKANPKYCYEWSFVEPGRVAILNLWFARMKVENGLIVQRNNFRADARGNAGNSTWVRRATKLDQALQAAVRDNLIVRVIVNDGRMREHGSPSAKKSEVLARQLDPEFWTITQYDWDTGENTLVRGILRQRYVDQFDTRDAGTGEPERVVRSGQVYKRDAEVRRQVLARAQGVCERCGEAGFLMHSGATYLETHHVVPLSEGGADRTENVVALCPNDHKKAHFSKDRTTIRNELLSIIGHSE